MISHILHCSYRIVSYLTFRLGMVVLMESQACLMILSPLNDDFTETVSYPGICHEAKSQRGAFISITGVCSFQRTGEF